MTSVALVTGAAGGIGQAIRARLAGSGFTVYGGDLSVPDDQSARGAALGPLDVRSAESIDRAVAAAARLGPIGAVVNCAGIVRHTPVDDMTDEDLLAVWNVNVAGAARICRAAVPHMPSGSAIVNIGSTSGFMGRSRAIAYSAAKGGVANLTRAMAAQLAPHRIRVNTVVPGWVMTERQKTLWATPEALEAHRKAQCLPDLIEPVFVARMVLFLASDDAKMCTANNYMVEAGSI